MNLLTVLFFSTFDNFNSTRGAPDLRRYLTQVHVGKDAATADHFALVIGRHNGMSICHTPSKEELRKFIPTSHTFHATAIVTLAGHAFNDVVCHKPAAKHRERERIAYCSAAIDLLRDLPPIYTGDLLGLLYDQMLKAPDHIRGNEQLKL